jgi:succinoglycan biosynthesis protein ExoL
VNAPRTLVFIGPERTDARSVKRIAALRDQGWHVLGFTYHRDHGQPDPPPAWENVHLGTTYNRRYVQRVFAILRGFWTVFRHRRRVRESGCLYAINPDNALLALFARFVCGRRVPLVVEIADIQPVMCGTGMRSRVLRKVERFVLKRCQLLLTTSPGFLRHYFEPVQKYRGPVFMLENRIYPSASLIASRQPREEPVRGGHPWVAGYFGIFRCQRSVDLICRLAAAFPETLAFELRGVPAGIDERLFRESISAHPNIRYGGAYRYPDELPDLYAAVDFNWCFDFSALGANSTWLLPNRIYEGGLFHCPALAFDGTETGRWLEANHLGVTFREDLYENLHAFFITLTLEKWQSMRDRCAAAPDRLFAGEADYVALSATLEGLSDQASTIRSH